MYWRTRPVYWGKTGSHRGLATGVHFEREMQLEQEMQLDNDLVTLSEG